MLKSTLLCSRRLLTTLNEIKVNSNILILNNSLYFHKPNCYCTSTLGKQPKKSKVEASKSKNERKSNNQVVVDFISSSDDLKASLTQVPTLYQKICKTSPPLLYLISESTAKHIARIVVDKLSKKCPIVEINPGFGCLTKNLLENGVDSLILFESSTHYDYSIQKLQEQYPNKIDYRQNDFFAMYKLMFQDTFDAGNRFQTLMKGINIDQESDDVSIQILGTMSSSAFLRSTLYSIIFTSGVLGRPELLVAVPPSAFYSLFPNETIKSSNLNNALSTLFQLLFDYSVIDKLPREHFLPWQIDLSTSLKNNTIKKQLLKMDFEHLILVNVKLKKKLPCNVQNLPLLWFFLKHNLGNRKIRIIPSLEQWIPGCGVWLITEQDPPETDTSLSPNEDDAPLPHMTIFTQFYDLTAQQKLTLFKRFISWPEFKSSPFSDEMDSYRMRMMSAYSSDSIKFEELYDQEHEDVENEE